MKSIRRKLKRLLKHPIKSYVGMVKHSIIPKPYSHQVKMNILIKKGQQSSTALIPCTIYAMDHSIDLNPALIRKKDKQTVKIFKPGKKIQYDSNNYAVELTEDEKNKGYILKELERCKHCGQKLVIAELKATRYRSCPLINVKLADKAKQDIIIPVEFGVNKSDIIGKVWITPILIFGMTCATIFLLGFRPIHIFGPLNVGQTLGNLVLYVVVICIWLFYVPTALYGTYKLFKWYKEVRPTMRKSIYAKQL